MTQAMVKYINNECAYYSLDELEATTGFYAWL